MNRNEDHNKSFHKTKWIKRLGDYAILNFNWEFWYVRTQVFRHLIPPEDISGHQKLLELLTFLKEVCEKDYPYQY